MYIRTQDRRNLVDMTGMTVKTVKLEPKNMNKIIAYSNHCSVDSYEVLGYYSSEEKAKKVLDMIQDNLVLPIYKNIISENETAIYTNKVFDMPEDSEVDV